MWETSDPDHSLEKPSVLKAHDWGTSKFTVPLDDNCIQRIAQLYACLGTNKFFDALWNSFSNVIDFNAGGIIVLYKDRPPAKIFLKYTHRSRETLNEDGYFQGPYALDPIYIMFTRGCKNGLYKISESTSSFEETDFYKYFYKANSVIDSVDIVWNIDKNSALLIFFEREEGQCNFSNLDISAVRMWLNIAFEALEKHFSISPFKNEDDVQKLFHKKVGICIDYFGSSILTAREMNVLAYMFKGYSVSKTAIKLGIAEATVKIHRSNIHQKLEVNSQTELFSLLIQSIPYANIDCPGDPLIASGFSPNSDSAKYT